ncbi:hypothetical protein GCM10023336_18540 [Streptomyces similanensis]|uniref:Uncharacterized protein n=1 Tax=Streptomyces similanensis TaxID=1274988 RepID=A0ABP9K6W7_9ACTN
MICDRCAEPIEGEPEVIPVDSASGAARDVYLCPTLCRPSTAFPRGAAARTTDTPKERAMKDEFTWRTAGGGSGDGSGGEGGDGLPGEPWPGPQEPPSPDSGPRFLG